MSRDVCTTCGASVRDFDTQAPGSIAMLPAHGCANPVRNDCEGARLEYQRQLNAGRRDRIYAVDPESWRKVWRMLLIDNHDPGDEGRS